MFLYQNKLTEQGADVRLLPPPASMNGLFYLRRIVWNINKKVYISPLSFNEECPIEEEIELAKEWATKNGDKQLMALINKMDEPYAAKKEEFLVPILLLDVKYNPDWTVASLKIVGDKNKYLTCTKQLLGTIVDKVTSKHFYNGTKEGITHREKGWNLTLFKKVKNSKTEYSCEGWREATEMGEKYYRELPDPVLFTKKGMLSDETLTSVIRNYLYGEPLIEEQLRYPELKDVSTSATSEQEEEASAPPRRGGPPSKAAPAPVEEEAQAEEAPAPQTAPPARTAKPAAKTPPSKAPAKEEAPKDAPTGPPKRNVLDDLSSL